MLSLLLIAALIYVAVCLLLVWQLPSRLVPAPRASGISDVATLAAARNSVRSTIGQLAAGFAFVFTFIATIYNTDRTLNQKMSQDTAELFFKVMSRIETGEGQKNPSSFFLLSQLAKNNPEYHEQIFSAIADHIRSAGGKKCKGKSDIARSSAHDYEISSNLKAATQVIGYRNFTNDTSNRKLNLEDACLAGVGLLEAWGMSRLYMVGANLVSADLRRTRIFDANMEGIDAGLDNKLEWPRSGQHQWFHIDAKHVIDLGNRFSLIANFEAAHIKDTKMHDIGLKGANLEHVHFERSILMNADLLASNLYKAVFTNTDVSGANLRNANVAYADLRGAKNLTIAQLASACIIPREDAAYGEVPEPRIPNNLKEDMVRLGYRVCGSKMPVDWVEFSLD